MPLTAEELANFTEKSAVEVELPHVGKVYIKANITVGQLTALADHNANAGDRHAGNRYMLDNFLVDANGDRLLNNEQRDKFLENCPVSTLNAFAEHVGKRMRPDAELKKS